MNVQDDLLARHRFMESTRWGHKHSKMPSFSGSGLTFASKCCFRHHGSGWQTAKRLRKSIKQKVQRPGRNSYSKTICLGQPGHQMQASIISFQTCVYSTKSLRQLQGIEPRHRAVATEVPTTVLRYITINLVHICAYSRIPAC